MRKSSCHVISNTLTAIFVILTLTLALFVYTRQQHGVIDLPPIHISSDNLREVSR